MNKPIRFKTKAENDFYNILIWYNEVNNQVADKFINEIDTALNNLSKNPKIGSKYKFKIRKYVLIKFPYIIFYVEEESEVIILAIFHGHSNPDTINQTLE